MSECNRCWIKIETNDRYCIPCKEKMDLAKENKTCGCRIYLNECHPGEMCARCGRNLPEVVGPDREKILNDRHYNVDVCSICEIELQIVPNTYTSLSMECQTQEADLNDTIVDTPSDF